jgi:winged helix DNA-binding protein
MASNLLLIDDRQRHARLGRRHHLARSARAADVVTVAGDLVGLHGTDPATVFLSTWARMRSPQKTVAALEDALYVDRRLVRTLCMRRTMFVVPVDAVPVVQAAVTDALVPGERRRTVQMIEQAGIATDGAAWLTAAEAATLAELMERREATGAELAKAVPGLAHQIPLAEGKSYATTVGVSTRVLFSLSTAQRIVRGRPRGSWTSSQYRWSPMEVWLPDGMPRLDPAAARAELVQRYLAGFGPATTADIKWWTGWTVAHTKAAVAAVGAVEVAMAGGVSGWVLPDDVAPVRAPGHWVAFLPPLDPTTMGWQRRGWYLGDHGPALFDRNGNAGPTVWADGRIVGGWTQRRSGEIVYRLLEDVGSETAEAAIAVAADLEAWLGPMRITPRFPTPLQKELST